MTKSAKYALGIFGAMAAGVLIGLLVAPEKGKDLRVKIKKRADKWTDQLSHMFSKTDKEDLKSGLKEKINKTKEVLS